MIEVLFDLLPATSVECPISLCGNQISMYCVCGMLELFPSNIPGNDIEVFIPSVLLQPEMPMDIWSYLLPEYLGSNLLFRRCNNCQRFFVSTGVGNPKYCDRIVEGTNKTCRLLMAKEKAHTKNTTNPINVLFNRTYKTMYSRVSAGKLDKEVFALWAKDAREVREKCEIGELPLETFAEWLEKSRTAQEYR